MYCKEVNDYIKEIPQSHTVDQPMAPRGRATEHLYSNNTSVRL